MAARKGRQTPTQSHILPYRRSLGTKAAALYKASGRRAQDWQKSLLKDMMACTQGKGLWIHTKFGFSVPRRSGKNEVLLIREMYGLVELGEHILHTPNILPSLEKAKNAQLTSIVPFQTQLKFVSLSVLLLSYIIK